MWEAVSEKGAGPVVRCVMRSDDHASRVFLRHAGRESSHAFRSTRYPALKLRQVGATIPAGRHAVRATKCFRKVALISEAAAYGHVAKFVGRLQEPLFGRPELSLTPVFANR